MKPPLSLHFYSTNHIERERERERERVRENERKKKKGGSLWYSWSKEVQIKF
jgi:hypothetical protein